MKIREYWLDYLRAFACVLVALGHLFMSFQDAHIIRYGGAVSVFIDLIYCFHVYIFFFCSGYLFQKKKYESGKKTTLYKLEKCVNFLVVYVIFSGVTYVIKTVLSSDVNTAVEGNFLETLLKYPINQMWYLYAISIIYLLAYPVLSKKAAYIITGVALLMKAVACIPALNSALPVPINYLFENVIWFVMGQLFAHKQVKLNMRISLVSAGLFVVIFVVRTILDLEYTILNAVLTFLGILASTGVIYGLTENKTVVKSPIKYIAKYMLQIYLLHTICAAGARIVLMKIGVTHILPHLIAGLVFSFVLPVICAVIAERSKILNVVFFPIETIRAFIHKPK